MMTRSNPSTLARLARTICLLLVGFAGFSLAASAAERLVLNFNPDWKFTKSDPTGAQQAAFNDADWSSVSTPHTYNDVDTFDNWSTPGHRGEQLQWEGRTWYRKTFTAPKAWAGKKVFIEFEGVRQIAEVYLNGKLLGVCKTGFTPFGFDLTADLKVGEANLLAVMVDNRFMKDPLDPATIAEIAKRNGTEATATKLSSTANINLGEHSKKVNESIPEKLEDLQADQIPWNNPHWHPAHGGIYRNVRLIVTDPLHISLPLFSFLETAGPYAYATEISDRSAKIALEVPVQNQRTTAENVELRSEVLDAFGHSVLTLKDTQAVPAGGKVEFKLLGTLANPKLWEPAYPHVYRLATSLRVAGKIVDTSDTPLGLRTVRWDASTGFSINGQHLKLHGWGQKPTNEWPGLGAALPNWLHDYTLQMMKDAGGNFVRWGHSAAGLEQIEAADRFGLVTLQPGVEGESDTVRAAWLLRTMAFRDMVIYYRNHPSILIWEGGNQKVTREHGQQLRGIMDQYDPHGGRAYAHRRADQITAEFMDIGVGTEGQREIATLPVVEGEYDREESPRRVWDNASPPNFGYPEAKDMLYQLTSEQYAVNQIGQYLKKLAPEWSSGGANWIFSDSTSGGRVPAEVARASGEVDGVRLAKEAYYVCGVMFRDAPQVHIIGHWSYPAGTKKTVYVASNGDDVELTLNGASLGHGKRTDQFLFTFADITWAPGELKAVASRDGKAIATQIKKTAGAPVALKLTPRAAPSGLRADGSDIVLFDVEAVDASGERCPTFQQRVDFETSGPGVWRGGYNSGKINSINNTFLDLEAGINRVAVRTTRTPGRITVTAKSAGLKNGSASVVASAFPADGGFSNTSPATIVATLPTQSPSHPNLSGDNTTQAAPAATKAKGTAMLGKFVKSLGYTGPNANIVHVEVGAQNGKAPYADREYVFAELPPTLIGADWVQVADADARYNAVDLIELAVKGGTVVTIAHDERVGLPEWLTKQFRATGAAIKINGKPMKLFERAIEADGSLTLGSNTDEAKPKASNMYVVLVNAAGK